ncbi:MAG: hypothetical protein D3922_15390 [Candidatus Electrothrix sp. AR1]|nr:hypothetical protein [Candidatus Electrothrix sp. AR1]
MAFFRQPNFNPKTSKNFLIHLATLLKPNGIIAIANYSTEDKSAFAKEWIGDWKLIYRDENDMKNIFPQKDKLEQLELSFSSNRSLILAKYINKI